jgi:hypothetical protein
MLESVALLRLVRGDASLRERIRNSSVSAQNKVAMKMESIGASDEYEALQAGDTGVAPPGGRNNNNNGAGADKGAEEESEEEEGEPHPILTDELNMTFDDLPPDILEHIVNKIPDKAIPAVRGVNRNFFALAGHRETRKRKRFSWEDLALHAAEIGSDTLYAHSLDNLLRGEIGKQALMDLMERAAFAAIENGYAPMAAMIVFDMLETDFRDGFLQVVDTIDIAMDVGRDETALEFMELTSEYFDPEMIIWRTAKHASTTVFRGVIKHLIDADMDVNHVLLNKDFPAQLNYLIARAIAVNEGARTLDYLRTVKEAYDEYTSDYHVPSTKEKEYADGMVPGFYVIKTFSPPLAFSNDLNEIIDVYIRAEDLDSADISYFAGPPGGLFAATIAEAIRGANTDIFAFLLEWLFEVIGKNHEETQAGFHRFNAVMALAQAVGLKGMGDPSIPLNVLFKSPLKQPFQDNIGWYENEWKNGDSLESKSNLFLAQAVMPPPPHPVYRTVEETLLRAGAGYNRNDIVKLAIEEYGAKDFDRMLITAAAYGRLEMCKRARELGATTFDTMKKVAVMRNRTNIVELAEDWILEREIEAGRLKVAKRDPFRRLPGEEGENGGGGRKPIVI